MILFLDFMDAGFETWMRFAGTAYRVWANAIEESVGAAREICGCAAGEQAHAK